jgi:N-methylhydantoinase A
VISAFGTLCVDLLHDYSRSLIKPVDELVPADVQTLFEELDAEATAALDNDQVPRDSQRLERSLDLRYGGQLKTLGIPLAGGVVSADTLASACERFYAEYERRYHYVTRDIGLELSVVRVRGRGLQQGPEPRPEVATSAPSPLETRPVLFEGDEGFVPTAVFDRADLGSGVELRGPLLVEQEDSTVIVPPQWSVLVDGDANLYLTHLAEDVVRQEQL